MSGRKWFALAVLAVLAVPWASARAYWPYRRPYGRCYYGPCIRPAVGIYIGPPPVVVRPAVVVEPAPVVVQPAPAPVVVQPAPAAVPPAAVAPPPPAETPVAATPALPPEPVPIR
jgi:hypothetical protein